MRKIANTSELQGELRRILDIAGGYQPSRVQLAAELRELSLRVASDKCLYCGHPKHKGGPTETISAAEGKKIWANRQRSSNGVGEDLGLTPAQCETVMKCWDGLPDNYTYGSTFTAITKHGSDAILEGRMPARGRRSASELGATVAGVVSRTASGLGSHFKKSLRDIKSGRVISAEQSLAQLDDDV